MQRVPAKVDFVALEEEILQLWESENFFAKLKQQVTGKPMFRFIDGPVTANNPMGVHHAWGRALKDCFIRYNVMNGKDCNFQNGFDCQGLWVEVEVEKQLGFQGKPDIEAHGLDKFSHACRDRVNTFAGVITDQSKRLGQWMDWEDSYYTHDDRNIRGIWHFLKVCSDNGWIYSKALPMPWCARCGTSLSEHEMAGSYKEMTHLSIYGQVPLLSDRSRRLLIWTTTPWTLSANVAAAVHPDLDYIEVKADDWDHTLILCEGAKKVLAGTGAAIVARFKGSDLVGERYETFHPEFKMQTGVEHRVVPWDVVDAAEGSGIVHIAPGCGKEDYELGKEIGLEPIVPIDENGMFFEGFGVLSGKGAADVPDEVAAILEASGKLFKAVDYDHKYPVCWRCKDPLVFRLVGEWFISCDEIRPRMKVAAADVQWKPAFMGARMQDWLDNMGDWCISRKRYWGLPLPFYVCADEDCGHLTVIGSMDQLRERALDPEKVDALPELHRPWIDDVDIHCEKCNKPVTRVAEVGDCWLDAGIVPYSTTGFFDDPEKFERSYPIEWVCEMREQVRLWFYSMLFMGTTLSDRSPYERVLAYERVVGEDGTMFSKTGYMIRFDEAADKIGADAMRWLYCRQPVTSDVRFGYAAGELAQRKLAGLWNIYSFVVTYALIDEPDCAAPLNMDALTVTDKWMLARSAELIEKTTAGYQDYDSPSVVREIESFLDDISNWYVRVNRRRFWKNEDAANQAAAYGVLYRAIKTLCLVLAPVAPFLTDSVWQNLVRSMEPDAALSVHHHAWPTAPAEWKNADLLVRTETVRSTLSLALNLREKASLRVRQPLRKMFVVGGEDCRVALAEQAELVKSELNVKELEIVDGTADFMRASLGLDFAVAGRALRKDVGKVKALLGGLDDDVQATIAAVQATGADVQLPGWDTPLPANIFSRKEVAGEGVEVSAADGITVALDTELDDALRQEGLVRDLVRKIQVLRKESGLDVSDRIRLSLVTEESDLVAGITQYESLISQEVLAIDLARETLADSLACEDWEIMGRKVQVALSRQG